MKKQTDKVAFVTGGSRGIGAAIVERLAEEGASVIFTYANSKVRAESLETSLRARGFNVRALKADSGVDGELTAAIRMVLTEFGQLDILVNNAGVYVEKPFEEHSLDDYDQTFAVNVRAVVEACLEVAKHMNPFGRIITIGSTMGERVAFPQGTIYSMSKSALIGLTKGLARDLGPKNITVNLVQPGPVNTDMNPEDSPGADFLRSMMAIPKFGRPEDIAGMVAYLASAEAGYATGAIFTLDGGINA